MAEAILQQCDQENCNLESKIEALDPTAQSPPFEQNVTTKIGKNWYKRYLGQHLKVSLVYSRKLDYSCAQNNNSEII